MNGSAISGFINTTALAHEKEPTTYKDRTQRHRQDAHQTGLCSPLAVRSLGTLHATNMCSLLAVRSLGTLLVLFREQAQ